MPQRATGEWGRVSAMLSDLTTPLDLDGAVLGPVAVQVTADRVAFYAEVTGESPNRWTEQAPPGFGSVLLFAVADLFLYHPKVVPYTATLLHLDQSFEYHAPMATGATISVEGTITRVRERAGSYFVTFVATGSVDSKDVVTSTSTFVLSDQSAPASDVELDEPAARDRGQNGGDARSASRHDLVRYAAASRDFNPLHWDHATAVGAGLPATVVHGLLMYAWLAQAAAPDSGQRIESMKVRFRTALHPGEQARVVASTDGDVVKLELNRDDTQLVTGAATVAATE